MSKLKFIKTRHTPSYHFNINNLQVYDKYFCFYTGKKLVIYDSTTKSLTHSLDNQKNLVAFLIDPITSHLIIVLPKEISIYIIPEKRRIFRKRIASDKLKLKKAPSPKSGAQKTTSTGPDDDFFSTIKLLPFSNNKNSLYLLMSKTIDHFWMLQYDSMKKTYNMRPRSSKLLLSSSEGNPNRPSKVIQNIGLKFLNIGCFPYRKSSSTEKDFRSFVFCTNSKNENNLVLFDLKNLSDWSSPASIKIIGPIPLKKEILFDRVRNSETQTDEKIFKIGFSERQRSLIMVFQNGSFKISNIDFPPSSPISSGPSQKEAITVRTRSGFKMSVGGDTRVKTFENGKILVVYFHSFLYIFDLFTSNDSPQLLVSTTFDQMISGVQVFRKRALQDSPVPAVKGAKKVDGGVCYYSVSLFEVPILKIFELKV